MIYIQFVIFFLQTIFFKCDGLLATSAFPSMNHVQIPLSLYKLTTPNESFIMLKKTASAEHEEKGNFKMLTMVLNSRDSAFTNQGLIEPSTK